jgi:hypothetical protein
LFIPQSQTLGKTLANIYGKLLANGKTGKQQWQNSKKRNKVNYNFL